MGHTPSSVKVPEWSNVQRHAANIKDIALLSYEQFVKSLKELNDITETFAKNGGKRLVFAIKKGTDNTMLWKATIKIGCVLVDVSSKRIDSYSLLTLNQYWHIYHMIVLQVEAKNHSTATSTCAQPDHDDNEVDDIAVAKGCEMSASALLNQVTAGVPEAEALDECCICLERKPEVILPCAHSYCVPCIAQWNVTNMTCPVCREEIENTDDSWVISEAPDSIEIEAEVQRLLDNLVERTKAL